MVGIRENTEGTIIKSVSMGYDIFVKAKEHNISLSEAVKVGLGILLAEKGVGDYDSNLNLVRKMQLFRSKYEVLSNEFEELKQKVARRV